MGLILIWVAQVLRSSSKQIAVKTGGTHCTALNVLIVSEMEDELLKRLSLPNRKDCYKSHTMGMKMLNRNSKGLSNAILKRSQKA